MESVIRLIEIMKILRDPERGCPWDREQSLSSILPYTLEEVHELIEAVERKDSDAIRSELGDLLFHVVFYARMAEEAGMFGLADVAAGICDKLESRHPHVFGTDTINSAAEQALAWESHKARERLQDGARVGEGFFADIATTLPALLRALKLQKRAAGVGFDWGSMRPVLDKIDEELRELRAALAAGENVERLQDEIGDLFFAAVNCARHAGVDPETALRAANRKFERRFYRIESELSGRGKSLSDASLEEMEDIWQLAKREEKNG